jgi:hypothetical protein
MRRHRPDLVWPGPQENVSCLNPGYRRRPAVGDGLHQQPGYGRQSDRVAHRDGDDSEAKAVVSQLVEEMGYVAVDLGGIATCAVMEAPRRPAPSTVRSLGERTLARWSRPSVMVDPFRKRRCTASDLSQECVLRTSDVVGRFEPDERVVICVGVSQVNAVGGLQSARGGTTREVAAKLLSPKTVEFHLRNVYDKLGVHSRSALSELMSEE